MQQRREFMISAAAVATSALTGFSANGAQPPITSATVDLPRGRVPLSFIIDDSTCLVNMGRFCMPQFAAAWPDRAEYDQPWQQWPAEIPDAFLREFADWCEAHEVKGKFSVVPNPACVGWLDRELPGWSQTALQESLRLVRERIVPHWDIHPEMITHTRVIDIKTGRPAPHFTPAAMENWYPANDASVDELAAYMAYALRILKNCDLPCEGITTPGGFGNRVRDKLPLAVFQAVRDVYGTELPHYFKYIVEGDADPSPRLESLRDADSDSPLLTVSVPAGTGDWFGGWDGARPNEGHLYCNEDATAGRMVELIRRRQPAIMFCHWPGLYNLGAKSGLQQFQQIVMALKNRFGDETLWMKVSEIGRYWAARTLTKIEIDGCSLQVRAPFAVRDFTLRVQASGMERVTVAHEQQTTELTKTTVLRAGTWRAAEGGGLICFDLARGETTVSV